MTIKYQDLGLIDYKIAWDFQEDIFNRIIQFKTGKSAGPEENHLLFCEHPHVYTLGKSGEANNLLISAEFLKKINATFYRINRGGDITYHGPGQIVGYPVLDLEPLKLSLKEYIYKMEEAIIITLLYFNLSAARLDGATGVWLDAGIKGKARKICAIGVRASRYVTMHGFALNVNTDLSYFNHINPCGFVDKGVTSLKKELQTEINIDLVKQKLIEALSLSLGVPVSRQGLAKN